MKTINRDLLRLICGANSQNSFGPIEPFVGPPEKLEAPPEDNPWYQPECFSCDIRPLSVMPMTSSSVTTMIGT